MQLIDALELRTDSIRLVESVQKVEANYDGEWTLLLDGAAYVLSEDAFDTLLNLLRIPIKYIKRCVEDEGKFLAEASINYWLEKNGDLSYLVQNDRHMEYGSEVVTMTITQVFPGKRLYIPGVKVNDLIFDYLEDCEVWSYDTDDDVFSAVYLTSKTVGIHGQTYNEGVRVLYSDCFKITPRFDGILVDKVNHSLFAYPTTKRKFRVAGSTIPQVFEQIEEFIDLSLEGLRELVIPALKRSVEDDIHRNKRDFVALLCAQLRLSRKIENEILSWFGDEEVLPEIDLLTVIAAHTAADRAIEVETAREIQIALSNYIIEETFK